MAHEDESEEQKSERVNEDEVLWQVAVDRVFFSTEVILPDSERGSAAETEARERLADAIRNGEVDVRWQTTPNTKADLEYDETMAEMSRCERCEDPSWAGLEEIDRERQGEFYEFDFEPEDDRFISVCTPCKEEMWEKAHTDTGETEAA